MIVAIDGPAGAGKSTVASRLAERLGFRYLDTGAMYRALTWLAKRDSVPLDKGARLSELAAANPVDFDEHGRCFIAGTDVTAAIRRAEIDRLVPVVARHPAVRHVLRARQRARADDGNVVIQGPATGTAGAPDGAGNAYRLTGTRAAVVHETAGVTRDRKQLVCEWAGERFLRIDTGGVDVADRSPITRSVVEQARAAVGDADLVLFVVDASLGITPGDEEV